MSERRSGGLLGWIAGILAPPFVLVFAPALVPAAPESSATVWIPVSALVAGIAWWIAASLYASKRLPRFVAPLALVACVAALLLGPGRKDGAGLAAWQFVPLAFAAAGALTTALQSSRFLRENLVWWLAPIVLVLGGLTAFVFLTDGDTIAPFFYAIF